MSPRLPQTFNAAAMPPQKRERLENLLDQIDTAAAARKSFDEAGQFKALKVWLDNPQEATQKLSNHDKERLSTFEQVFSGIPADRLQHYIDEFADICHSQNGGADTFARLNALSREQKITGMAYAAQQGNQHVDASQNETHWNTMSKLYNTVLSEYPNILTTKEDIAGAQKIAGTLRHLHPLMQAAWPHKTTQEKNAMMKRLFTETCPDENADHLHMATLNSNFAAAAFSSNVKVDTMYAGDQLEKLPPALGVFLYIHEYQHRRQRQLVQQLEDDKLQKGSAAYYQARLFKANQDGGYLQPMVAANQLETLAKTNDYMDQPVERQANDAASLTCALAGTGGDKIWAVADKAQRGLSTLSQPAAKLAQKGRALKKAFGF
ncbi:MAG: hypothetical protein OXT65_00795 [Alphaproteobacteria bacterium]|nr:hypothetical protein [Alphaproteobacteria bacterium]